MRQSISILLSLLFIYYSAGYYVSFKTEEYLIKKSVKLKIKNQIPENELIHFVFDPSSEAYLEIDWIEKHEFRYRDKMYDVVRQSIDSNGFVELYCINDNMEEMLFADLKKLIENLVDTQSTGKPQNQPVKKFYDQLFLSRDYCNLPAMAVMFSFISFLQTNTLKVYKNVPDPPPRRV